MMRFLSVYEKAIAIVNGKYTVFPRGSASIFWGRAHEREKEGKGGFETSPFRGSFLLFSSPL